MVQEAFRYHIGGGRGEGLGLPEDIMKDIWGNVLWFGFSLIVIGILGLAGGILSESVEIQFFVPMLVLGVIICWIANKNR